jgi:hypothetical protein
MASFLDYLIQGYSTAPEPQQQMARNNALMGAGANIVAMASPQPNNYKPGVLQMISSGLTGYQKGGNDSIEGYYNDQVNQSKVTAAQLQDVYNKQNLDWFNKNPEAPQAPTVAMPKPAIGLGDFYKNTSGQPLSVRNNNPTNIKDYKTGGFKQFTTPEDGYNYATQDLTGKISGNSPAMTKKYGAGYVPTIDNIIDTWAPPSDNNPNNSSYKAQVAQAIGKGINDPLSPDDAAKIARAMTIPEGGQKAAAYFNGQSQQAPQPTAQPANDRNTEFAQHLYYLAERQMRSGQPGGENLLKVASMYDPSLERINKAGMPAALQLADAYKERIAAGDIEGAKKIEQFAKINDKGMVGDGQGGVVPIPGYNKAVRDKKYSEQAGEEGAKSDYARLNDQSKVVSRLPLLEQDLSLYETKLQNIDPSLMGPIRGTAAYYVSPEIQALTSNARSVALQLKDIYNLGNGQGFTDADRNYLDSIIGGAKVDPIAAADTLKDMYARIQAQKDTYTQMSDYYKQNNTLNGYMPTSSSNKTSGGVKFLGFE